jgi:MFS family permease
MFAALTSAQHARTRSLIAAIACAAVTGTVFGLSMPLIAIRIEEMTGSALQVGINGFAAAVSTLIMAPFVPRLMGMLSPRKLLMIGLLAGAILFPVFPLIPDIAAWFINRLVIGCFVTLVFVISESWINQIVTPERRALMLGVYGTMLSGGFGLGALLYVLIGQSGDTGFYVASAIFLAGLVPIMLLTGPAPVAPAREETSPKAMIAAARTAPTAIAAGLAFGAIETLVFSLIAVYGERIGLDRASAGVLVIAIALGALAFQIPLGWIADKTNRRKTLFWIAAIATAGPVLAVLAGTQMMPLLIILFIQAGVASGLYTIGLALLGERFTGGTIAAANAAFIFAYGIGSVIAPPTAGLAMDALGPWGLMLILTVLAGGYVLFMLFRSWRTAARS